MTKWRLNIVVWSGLCLDILIGNKNATFCYVFLDGKLSTMMKVLLWNRLMVIDVSDDYKLFIALCLYWMHVLCPIILIGNKKARFCTVLMDIMISSCQLMAIGVSDDCKLFSVLNLVSMEDSGLWNVVLESKRRSWRPKYCRGSPS